MKNTTDSRELIQGTVIRSVGSSSRVKTLTGKQYDCIIRGKFRIEGLNTTNPVAVGDEVLFSEPGEGETGVIQEILPRKNYILRKAISQTHKVHILAANMDQAILLFTIDQPVTSTGFANRFLVVAEAYHIPAKIVINKIDLLHSPEQLERLEEITNLYSKIGYEVIQVSSLDARYKEKATQLLSGKVSFVGGHSGSGKSTFINLADPDLDIKTSEVSEYTNKGTHTTTFAEMHALAGGGYIIDTPGIKEWGITDFERTDLSHYFPEMQELLSECRFNNCTHTNEPKCAIKAAVEAGEIHASRYDSYLRMLEETEG
ncbi:MAG: ribosome small subunit-dependent GTPase A [Bacteroidia bacterium]|nr:ribosome small subunit-dependent GTPase A [Bacteroidia bacterium]